MEDRKWEDAPPGPGERGSSGPREEDPPEPGEEGPPGREFHLNSDFDSGFESSLPADPSSASDRFEREWHFLWACGREDSLLVHEEAAPSMLDYWRAKGLEVPRRSVFPAIRAAARFTPFGWDAAMEARGRLYAAVTPHPALEVVRACNSRASTRGWEEELRALLQKPYGEAPAGGRPPGERGLESLHCERLEEALAWIVRNKNRALLAKGNHGHSARNNLRLGPHPLREEERRKLEDLFSRTGSVVLEPWRERVRDYGCLFSLSPSGAVENLLWHETLNTAAGAFAGIHFAPAAEEGLLEARFRRIADFLGGKLKAEGYWGPVGFDSFSYREESGPGGPAGLPSPESSSLGFRPLVDVNARHTMAYALHGLRRKLGGAVFTYRHYGRRRLELPLHPGEFEERLSPASRFDPRQKRGILLVTPLAFASLSSFDPASSSFDPAPAAEPFSLRPAARWGLAFLHPEIAERERMHAELHRLFARPRYRERGGLL